MCAIDVLTVGGWIHPLPWRMTTKYDIARATVCVRKHLHQKVIITAHAV